MAAAAERFQPKAKRFRFKGISRLLTRETREIFAFVAARDLFLKRPRFSLRALELLVGNYRGKRKKNSLSGSGFRCPCSNKDLLYTEKVVQCRCCNLQQFRGKLIYDLNEGSCNSLFVYSYQSNDPKFTILNTYPFVLIIYINLVKILPFLSFYIELASWVFEILEKKLTVVLRNRNIFCQSRQSVLHTHTHTREKYIV